MGRLPALLTEDSRNNSVAILNPNFDLLDLSALVQMRRLHQTRQATKGVRTKQHPQDSSVTEAAMLRRQLIRRFHEVLRENQEVRAVGSGIEREARWHTNIPNGNAANAAAAATVVNKAVRSMHHRHFRCPWISLSTMLGGYQTSKHLCSCESPSRLRRYRSSGFLFEKT